MNTMNFTDISPAVADRLSPLAGDILKAHSANIHSFHVVGSAVLPDYDPKISDINSVVVLHRMDLKFISFLAPLGRRHGKKGIAAPLVMTPGYIEKSLDAFPVEFLDFKLIHRTVYGPDLFKDISVAPADLRLQCEREIKTRLIQVHQGYLSSLGQKKELGQALARFFTGSMALFRAVIALLGKEPPIPRNEVIASLALSAKIDAAILEDLLALKHGSINPSEQELQALFENYYRLLESLEKTIDEIRR